MVKYSEDKNNPLNRKIAEVFAANSFEDCKKLCREIYEIGMEDGQAFVWKVRAGDFDSFEVNPDLPEDIKKMVIEKHEQDMKMKQQPQMPFTITSSNSKEITFAEMVSGKLVMKHGVPDDQWGTR
jgi:hypothetical protein